MTIEICNFLDCLIQQPWLTRGGIYLLYDFAPFVRNIRNNTLTEKRKNSYFMKEEQRNR